MSIFFWKNNKSIDAFANELANELFSSVQPQLFKEYFQGMSNKDKAAKKNKKNIDAKIQGIIKQIQQFRASYALGVYGKARLQLKFNERLKELGYESDAVAKLNEIILVKAP